MNNITLAIISGVSIYVLGQITIKFVIEPIHAFRKVIGEINYSLLFYAQAIHTPVGDRESEKQANEKLRQLASDLQAKAFSIPIYGGLSKIIPSLLPEKSKVEEATKSLIGLSNSVFSEDRSRNYKRVEKIGELLKLKQKIS